jgi:hypothetical protein
MDAAAQLAAARHVERVVRVASVGEAAAREHETAVAQPAQVVGDEALALARELAQLPHAAVALAQRAQQPPAHRVAGEAQERRRRRRHDIRQPIKPA